VASIEAVSQGIQTRLATISGLNAYESWPDTFIGPGVIVMPQAAGAEDQTLGESTVEAHDFELLVAVPNGMPMKTAQQKLSSYISNTGAASIRAAIVGDRTLGGAAITTYFGAWTELDDEPINGIGHLGHRLPVRVWTA
jgi:predicted ATP-grasp superfamily ATP-dependent carboligase